MLMNSRRRAFTLVEMIVVIVLLGIVVGGLSTMITRQQRFYRGANEIIETRGQLRQATTVFPIELRGASSIAGDILAVSDTSIRFNATFGSSIVCTGQGTTTITMPPAGVLASGAVFTGWLRPPGVGDGLFVYNTATRVWDTHAITAVVDSAVTTVNCPVLTGYTGLGDATLPSLKLTLGTALAAGVMQGAPIRFYRQADYTLYQAADNRWYLGYDSCRADGTSCDGRQPVSGPYRGAARAATGISGLTLQYFDSTGAEIVGTGAADRQNIARVDVTARAQSEQAIPLPGQNMPATFADSLGLSVALRNRQ